jgi:amidase
MNKSILKNSFILILLAVFFLSCEEGNKEQTAKSPSVINLQEVTIAELQSGYQDGTFTIREVVEAYLQRIDEIDKNGPALNSIIEINPDALQIADELDKEYAEGKIRGALHGIPVFLKDNIDTHDKMSTTAGSRALAGSHPKQDSYIAAKLRESGAVILGKTNLSEWANFRGELSSSGWSGVGGQTKNPYILDRNPCGSSSGSGVAVSANLCVVAIGTETNGSIVCPSTSNGIVGIKPTVGLLSRSGIIPISFTQDTPGPMARTVTDAVITLGAMTGIDESDSKTILSEGNSFTDYTQFLNKDGLTGKRIGLYTAPLGKHYKVDALMEETVEYLKNQGVEIVEIEEISVGNVGDESFDVMLYEFKDGLNNYFASLENPKVNSLAELIEFNLNDSIELSFYDQELLIMAEEKGDLNSPEYLAALDKMKRTMGAEGIDRVMDLHNLDAIMAPTGSPAWKTDHVNGDAYILGSSSPAAISGYPNITVPMGFIEELPVGVSFFGRAWSEPVLIEIAYAYEQGTNHRKAPYFLQRD